MGPAMWVATKEKMRETFRVLTVTHYPSMPDTTDALDNF